MNEVLLSRISEWELRRKFASDEGQYSAWWDELEIACTYDEPASPKSRQDIGTRSRVLKFSERGLTVMVLHAFVRPNGSLGASGKFDPKRLLVNGIVYYS
jgi:hypothetical protein